MYACVTAGIWFQTFTEGSQLPAMPNKVMGIYILISWHKVWKTFRTTEAE